MSLTMLEKISTDALLGMHFLAEYAEIVHCGLRLENLRICFPQNTIETALLTIFQRVRVEEEARLLGQTKQQAKSKKLKSSDGDAKIHLLTQK